MGAQDLNANRALPNSVLQPLQNLRAGINDLLPVLDAASVLKPLNGKNTSASSIGRKGRGLELAEKPNDSKF